jgi:hypothetical protein
MGCYSGKAELEARGEAKTAKRLARAMRVLWSEQFRTPCHDCDVHYIARKASEAEGNTIARCAKKHRARS